MPAALALFGFHFDVKVELAFDLVARARAVDERLNPAKQSSHRIPPAFPVDVRQG
jgi:hypothetical protein